MKGKLVYIGPKVDNVKENLYTKNEIEKKDSDNK